MKRRICFAVLACLLPIALFGQADRATITGTVTDSSGAVVPSVEVKYTVFYTGFEETPDWHRLLAGDAGRSKCAIGLARVRLERE